MAGMAFDGALAMKRLAVLLKDEVCKHALYIYCFAHCNYLAFKDVTSLSRMVTDAHDFCENMYSMPLLVLAQRGFYFFKISRRNWRRIWIMEVAT
jgi:membrane-associated PAP2 superfamily phosphatase